MVVWWDGRYPYSLIDSRLKPLRVQRILERIFSFVMLPSNLIILFQTFRLWFAIICHYCIIVYCLTLMWHDYYCIVSWVSVLYFVLSFDWTDMYCLCCCLLIVLTLSDWWIIYHYIIDIGWSYFACIWFVWLNIIWMCLYTKRIVTLW